MEVFKLLGIILDDLLEEQLFKVDWQDNFAIAESNNSDIIGLILPMLNIEERNWSYVVVKISDDEISEIVLSDISDRTISSSGERISDYMIDIGMNDTYAKICHEISRKIRLDC